MKSSEEGGHRHPPVRHYAGCPLALGCRSGTSSPANPAAPRPPTAASGRSRKTGEWRHAHGKVTGSTANRLERTGFQGTPPIKGGAEYVRVRARFDDDVVEMITQATRAYRRVLRPTGGDGKRAGQKRSTSTTRKRLDSIRRVEEQRGNAAQWPGERFRSYGNCLRRERWQQQQQKQQQQRKGSGLVPAA